MLEIREMGFILNGCQEGKGTARPVDVLCPGCGAEMEVFEHMGSERAGQVECDEKCPVCGYVITMNTFLESLKKC